MERRTLVRGDRRRAQRRKGIAQVVTELLGNGSRMLAVGSHEHERRWRFAHRGGVAQDRPMHRPAVVTAATAVTALLALGCLALAIGHSGIAVPLVSRLGPGGGRAVVPAAIAFAVATILLVVLAVGLWRRRAWAWAAGLAVHGVVLAGASFPYRGWGSLVGIVLAGTAFILLASRPGREALLSST